MFSFITITMIMLYKDHPIRFHRGRGSRGLDLLILILVARWRRVLNNTSRPLYPRERTLVPTVGPQANVDVLAKRNILIDTVVPSETL